MPTASPIISASSGVELPMMMNFADARTPPIVTPMPTRAVRSGIPAASSEPNAMKSTTPANTTPRPSVGEMLTELSWKTDPPKPIFMCGVRRDRSQLLKVGERGGFDVVLLCLNCTAIMAVDLVRGHGIRGVLAEWRTCVVDTGHWQPRGSPAH